MVTITNTKTDSIELGDMLRVKEALQLKDKQNKEGTVKMTEDQTRELKAEFESQMKALREESDAKIAKIQEDRRLELQETYESLAEEKGITDIQKELNSDTLKVLISNLKSIPTKVVEQDEEKKEDGEEKKEEEEKEEKEEKEETKGEKAEVKETKKLDETKGIIGAKKVEITEGVVVEQHADFRGLGVYRNVESLPKKFQHVKGEIYPWEVGGGK